jgi:hypothetical protein
MSDLEYRREWSRQVGARVKTGIVNRFLLDHTGDLAYRWLLRRLGASHEPWKVLRDVYSPVAWKRALFPIADRLRDSPSG